MFQPETADDDRCGLCKPRKRNQPIDLWLQWAERG